MDEWNPIKIRMSKISGMRNVKILYFAESLRIVRITHRLKDL